ncbi:MAG: ribonucleoside-diphosphate reductase subunit alpha [Planctomycetes bacterium]|nr:ribonucleoside-diphosphate reductase subunit alpha [Planctomycetota bacterium]
MVVRRNGDVVPFDSERIERAIKKAFLAVEGAEASLSSRVQTLGAQLATQVVDVLRRRLSRGGMIHIEDIQDQVELALMRASEHKVARAYVLYREEQSRKRKEQGQVTQPVPARPATLHVTLPNGSQRELSGTELRDVIQRTCEGLVDVDPRKVFEETTKALYEGIKEVELEQALVMSARSLVETEPNYSFVAARLLLDSLQREAMGRTLGSSPATRGDLQDATYADYFPSYVRVGVEAGLLDPRLAEFDLDRISNAIVSSRDEQFTYLGMQTLYDRYLLHIEDVRFEMPQALFMRVAMGLAICEVEREEKAIAFYETLSKFDFMCSTPTLFNSGTQRPQLSSCFLTTVPDDLEGIFNSIRDNAMLAKFSGGLGNDWTRVRGMGSRIKGTNGQSQGVVPFMKVTNDTAVAVNQGGKRKGAVCGYLETWHIDIEEFLELRKNTGDDRRRTHDMNTANWIPDLFMKRVHENGEWTLLSPDECADLHELYGSAFEEAYLGYEAKVAAGEIRVFKKTKAVDIWRKMLSMLFETGHPWVTFKDPCNIRSPQGHVGVVHSSNLCTEITLNTSDREIAVCNLGSVNLVNHITPEGTLDVAKLETTIQTAMRMLDNVIDINLYTVPSARRSNLRHRPVGLGLMGFQDALFKLRIPYASEAAAEFADRAMEQISYFALSASSDLAEERGRYASFDGSLWSRGILPIDSLDLLREERGGYLDVDTTQRLDWEALRARIQEFGMRNSNCMAIAPTATIANITGVSQSIEPIYKNLFAKSNLSGEFTITNHYLVADLKRLGLWDEVMVHDLKFFDGSVQPIERIPAELRELYATAFEVDPTWLVLAASRRQKWIDQAQSLNLYMAEPSGKKLDQLYRLAWTAGLKTTYYLRALGASHAEKSTISTSRLNAVSSGPQICSITDPDCEACQ